MARFASHVCLCVFICKVPPGTAKLSEVLIILLVLRQLQRPVWVQLCRTFRFRPVITEKTSPRLLPAPALMLS